MYSHLLSDNRNRDKSPLLIVCGYRGDFNKKIKMETSTQLDLIGINN